MEKKIVKIVGPCSKWQGEWVTEVSLETLKSIGLVRLEDLKKAFWQYIAKHGVVIDNGNIDYIVEQALKEYRYE